MFADISRFSKYTLVEILAKAKARNSSIHHIKAYEFE
jgi:hypothetical protein